MCVCFFYVNSKLLKRAETNVSFKCKSRFLHTYIDGVHAISYWWNRQVSVRRRSVANTVERSANTVF